MTKHLKACFPEKCIGCELCVFESQRQQGRLGFKDTLIRIFKQKKEGTVFLSFFLDVDPRVDSLEIEKIKNICPTDVFEIEEMPVNDQK